MNVWWWWLRRTVKGIACRYMTIIESCDDCGRHQPLVWTASDVLWGEVTDKQSTLTDGGGVLCPECFNRRAGAKYLMIRWVPVLEYRGEVLVETHEEYMQMLTSR